ncbi:MAG: prepilin-type N-terminal cleavage/methylation domain-containing protein [Methylacidiphilales bacterium]|nr:prepilin-type N-terminal cleavage/methylation domain-containing protein [Candidatus Methylacidiphilales bacterium]
MNTFRHFLRPGRSSFTLVELISAVAILSILLLGFSQILSLSLVTWQQGLIRANCYTKARVVLDAATADIQRGVFRSDLNNFPSNTVGNSPAMPTFTFYTRAAGMNTGAGTLRPVSLVTYQLSTNTSLPGYLLRSENTINWTNSTSSAVTNVDFEQTLSPVSAATTTSNSVPPNDLLSTGIVDFEMIFLLSDGTTVLAKDYQSPSTASVVMIGVAVAVMDDKVLALLQPATSSKFSTIQSTLESAFNSTNFATMVYSTNATTGVVGYTSSNTERSIKELWDPAIAPLYQQAGYPKDLSIGLQTFERFVPCTPFN